MATSENSRQARIDLKKKRSLERKFIKDLRPLNNKIVKAATKAFVERGEILNAQLFFDDMDSLLLKNYNRTGESFDTQLSDSFPKSLKATDNETTLIAALLAAYYFNRSPQQTRFILGTTQKNITESIISGLQEASASVLPGELPSRRIAGMNAGRTLRLKLNGRNRGIATTEVQNIAEQAKQIEATTLTTRPGIEFKPSKEWITVGDEIVRRPPGSKFNHVAADGQKVKIDENFIVSGQTLRIPGDTSLGASLGNVIHCRCTSTISKKEALKSRKFIFDSDLQENIETVVPAPEFAFT